MDLIPAEGAGLQAVETQASLRFALAGGDLAALAASKLLTPVASRAQTRRDALFDTAGFALATHGLVLRASKTRSGARAALLREDGRVVAQARSSGSCPDPAAFGAEWEAALSPVLAGAPLLPLAEIRLKRTACQFGDTMLVFEAGYLASDGRRLEVHELELSGPVSALPDAALMLAAQAPLRLQPEALETRALRLAGAPPPAVEKAGAGVAGDPCLDDAVHGIISACVAQFRANMAVFLAGGDAMGAVHQMRVALRRLRSALELFSSALPAPEFSVLRAEAKRIASALGEARNWDVFLAFLHTGPSAAFPDEPGFTALEAQSAAHREAGHRQARALLDDPATTRFLLMAEAVIAKRAWRGNLPAESLPILAAPARDFGAECLEHLYRKVRKRGRHLAALPAHDRHQLRIKLKKLRYAAEFFGPLFAPRRRVKAFNAATAALQEELGKLNDMATAKALALNLKADEPEVVRALGIVLGWTAQAEQGEPRALSAAWEDFEKAKLFT